MLLELKKEIRLLGFKGSIFKPHKLIALLSAFEVIRRNDFVSGIIYFNPLYKSVFSDFFHKFVEKGNNICRPHTPFFHLQTASFWKLVPKEGKNEELESMKTVGGPGALIDVVDYAIISNKLLSALKIDASRKELKKIIYKSLKDGGASDKEYNRTFEEKEEILFANPFVDYLNTLQRSGGSNENALAESQACNPQFASIHVSHPLAKTIFNELNAQDGKHVILTGHAGDGKSTIALEVFKRFSGVPADFPLKTPLKSREDVADGPVSVFKDISERNKTHDPTLLDELSTGQRRFLLVSNTGTLLDFIKGNPDFFNADQVTLESKVLDAISTESGESVLELGAIRFRVFNLARMDNLALAEKVFEKMFAPEQWANCGERACSKMCPIYRNVDLIQKNQTRVIERIFLAYRRMYEYGTRLTMRQITEHLSYMITSGLDKADVRTMQQRNSPPLITKYLFLNRFFGDDGCCSDASADEMKSVQEIHDQNFGERPCPQWEHRLWLRSAVAPFDLGIVSLAEEFERLRKHGSREADYKKMSSAQAREQVRRMIYFLYAFDDDDEAGFLGQFLNSPTLLDWQSWQKNTLGFQEKTTLEQKIYHVLQEHFTGVRLPEGSTQNDRRLYVTLSRKRNEVRQSAQVVLAQVDWTTAIALKLINTESAAGFKRQDLVLCGKDRIAGVDLSLKVPFLDYVMMRHFGELGEVLEASYLERLDRFKAQVYERATEAGDDRIMLVRLKTDHTFRRQHFAVSNGCLEVTDVL